MVLGLDVGGTKIEAVLLDVAGRERWRERVGLHPDDYPAMLGAIGGLVAGARRRRRRAAGADHRPGHAGQRHHGWPPEERQLGMPERSPAAAADLETLLAQPVRLANDANCLALSEAIGARAGAPVVFAVILGTGVGGGIAVHGRVLIGPNPPGSANGATTRCRGGPPTS